VLLDHHHPDPPQPVGALILRERPLLADAACRTRFASMRRRAYGVTLANVTTPGADDEDDAVVLAAVRAAVADLPEVEEAALQGRPLFRVRRRRFAIANLTTSPPRPRWQGCGRSLHVLAEVGELGALLQDPRFERSPHHGSTGWVALALDDLDHADWVEVRELVESGYRRAAGRALVEQLGQRRDRR
jgi:hypothetical protein